MAALLSAGFDHYIYRAMAGKGKQTKESGMIIEKSKERCILVGVTLPHTPRRETEENLEELTLLAESAGYEVVHTLMQNRSAIDPAFYIGKGKVNELFRLSEMLTAAIIIFDADLSPAQIKNLQKISEIKIIDRSMLIMDIFAGNASTREAKTQVELANLQYMLSRLTRFWTHLERQVGGIGARGGMGEKQIEIDRRLMRNRIAHLKEELQKIELQRRNRRQSRSEIFKVALVGYTNVGKSTLMNALTNANVLVENKLFATLDTTVRSLRLDKSHKILLSDTVGFIRNLPHHLIASFRSTLQETRDADLILKIIDASHDNLHDHLNTIENTLEQIDCSEHEEITVFNKIDLLEPKRLLALKASFPQAVFISAEKQLYLNELQKTIIRIMDRTAGVHHLEIPNRLSRSIDFIHRNAVIISCEFEDSTVHLSLKADRKRMQKIKKVIREEMAETGIE